MEVKRILILGNSITHHKPKAEIGWMTDWGMAASAPENDYVHRLLQYLMNINNGNMPEAIAKNIATYEREYASFDIAGELEPLNTFHPDVVVVAIGENIPAPKDTKEQEMLLAALRKLLKLLGTNGNPEIFVRSCFWAHPVKDELLRQVCAEVDGTFVDISLLHKDETNFARSERSFADAGVANHPGDRGMAAIALAIGEAIAKKMRHPSRRQNNGHKHRIGQ